VGNPSAADLIDVSPSLDTFLEDVLAGLRRRPKRLLSKYLYDERGSQLFENICDLEEYYPTRTELGIMRRSVREMAREIGPLVRLVEYGSGASVKTRLLLDALQSCAAYIPVDISGDHLQQVAQRLAAAHPEIEILPVCADFTEAFDGPVPDAAFDCTVVYFPGSTIGNFGHDQAVSLLGQMADQCGTGGGLLIGIDLQKDVAVIEAAYNDRRGVTAEFNLNLLARINRELEADFDLGSFTHRAPYNRAADRIEMHLVSDRDQTAVVAGEAIRFRRGESICTEHSHKYTIEGFAAMAARAGFALQKVWTDARRYFAVLYFSTEP
jgi:dimethylhistidine N-methyltransferase